MHHRDHIRFYCAVSYAGWCTAILYGDQTDKGKAADTTDEPDAYRVQDNAQYEGIKGNV